MYRGTSKVKTEIELKKFLFCVCCITPFFLLLLKKKEILILGSPLSFNYFHMFINLLGGWDI